ncbi:MAG: prepilin-type N-terminal cleavage/methylation domain-containing protein [Halieaceae bacterium]|nr:prepilin-type N-terminal cleavage/methylation domain-containing protein [Halieaceae bacterium]
MRKRSDNVSGMTLIELLIVVAIVGILAAVAGPAWNDQVIKSRRADARNTLLAAQIEQEQYRANNLTYATSMSAMGMGSFDSTSRDYYRLEVVSADATSFLITATPNGNQANDSTCNAFAVRQTGPEHSGYAALSCW